MITAKNVAQNKLGFHVLDARVRWEGGAHCVALRATEDNVMSSVAQESGHSLIGNNMPVTLHCTTGWSRILVAALQRAVLYSVKIRDITAVHT